MGGFQALGLLRAGPDELAYVPADAQIVAFADIREVRDSQLHQALREFGPPGEAARFQAETGIDLERDVDRLVAAMSPADAEAAGRPLLLARGRFDRDRIEGMVRQQGGTVEEYRGIRLMAHPRANIGIAFIEPGLVALGSPPGVRRALDVKGGQSPGIRSDADLMRHVRDIEGGHAWAVVRGAALAGHPDVASGLPSGLPGLPVLTGFTWLTARGHVDGSIRGNLRAEALDEADAQNLRDAIRGAVALGRMQMGHQPEWADLINSLELGGQGRTVSLGFAVPVDMLDSLRRMAPRGPAPPPDLQRAPRRAVPPVPPAVQRPSTPGPSVRPRPPAGQRSTRAPRVAFVPPAAGPGEAAGHRPA